ncbi:MAG: M1 family metallopeptidase [bacterium]
MKKSNKKIKKTSVRLPTIATPIHYAITLKPDLESRTFFGHETIMVSLEKQTKKITLHSTELSIKTVNIIFGKHNIEASKITYNTNIETVTFEFKQMLPKGKLKLSIVFTGILAENMRGFYTSKYVVDGVEHVMATTQFEATDARRAFPCFDEPTHKAVFDVNLIIPGDKMAISNTLPTSIIEHEAGYKIVSFASTPKMSTYLLAFIVGNFEWLEQKTKSGVLVRVLTVPGKSHQGAFALDVTVRCLEFYEEYFGISYPLNTLDMIAIPDFSSLAMENWGAITFREIGLLFDEKHTSIAYKQLVALVIAHELAHQWFGNLVTMEWWTHLWLNEGFATYIEFFAIDKLFPEYDIWSQFIVGATATGGHGLGSALHLDALSHTHPIEIEVHDPNEIGEIFDAVSYDKGAAVIRMLAEYLGEKDFQKGLQQYLKKHSYKNASTIHLWEAFEKVSKKPVKKMMSVWTKKAGYPILEAHISKNNILLSQKRYFSSSTSAKKIKDHTLWPIPISCATKDGEHKFPLMAKKQMIIPPPVDSWIKFNSRETSLYRTLYDKQLITLLQKPLIEKTLSVSDRVGIVRDAFSFAESGEMNTTDVLELVLLYKNETEYIVWIEIVSGLLFIANILHDTKSYVNFKKYTRDVLSEIITHVGFDMQSGESENNTQLRSLILNTASYFGNTDVIEWAKKAFMYRNEKNIHPDLRKCVYATLIREGGEIEYEILLVMYRNETLHEEKNRILAALGKTQNKKLLLRTLDFALQDEVRMQDRNGLFASVLTNPYGKDLGWLYLKTNWQKIGEVYGEGNHLLSRLISALNLNTTKQSYDDIKSFFKTHRDSSAERTIQQTLEHIDSNIKWLARDEIKISKWLKG